MFIIIKKRSVTKQKFIWRNVNESIKNSWKKLIVTRHWESKLNLFNTSDGKFLLEVKPVCCDAEDISYVLILDSKEKAEELFNDLNDNCKYLDAEDLFDLGFEEN